MNWAELKQEIASLDRDVASWHTRAVVAHATFSAEQRLTSAQFGSDSPELAAVEAETGRVYLELKASTLNIAARQAKVKRLLEAYKAFIEAEKTPAGREALMAWLDAKQRRATTVSLTAWMAVAKTQGA